MISTSARAVARRVGRRLLPLGLLVLLVQALGAGPASAHADFVDSDPASGSSLARPPSQVTLTFTEGVNPVDDGFQLVDDSGDTVDTREPSATGAQVSLPIPHDLPKGSYLLSWRVLSSDGHPIAGAISFGVGVAAADIEQVQTSQTAQTASWPVVTARYAGYLGFSLITGALAFVLLCGGSGDRAGRVQALARAGLVLGAAATAVAVVVQGPYVAGLGLDAIGDGDLLSQTLDTDFGLWAVWRLTLYGGVAILAWKLAWLTSPLSRGASAVLVAAIAFTFSGTGHAAATGQLIDRVTDAAHALTAGIWVGGLIVLTVLGRSTSSETVRRFSGVALVSVVVLVGTGLVNSWSHLTAVADLWQTRYGGVLVAKTALVAGALLVAFVSRRSVGRGSSPWSSVRIEAVLTVVVLAATSVLTLTSPPSQLSAAAAASPGAGTDPGAELGIGAAAALETDAAASTLVEMDLGQGRSAELHVDGLTTAGSSLHLALLDGDGQPLPVNRVELTAGLPGADVAALPVPLTKQGTAWVSDFGFTLPGTWKLTLTVEDTSLAGVVTAGDVTIRG